MSGGRPGVLGNVWLVLLAGGALATVVFLALPSGSVAQALVFVGVQLTAAALAVGRAVLRRGEGLRGWRWMAAGQGVYLCATVPWYLRPVVFGQPVQYPSVVDVVYFAAYSLFAVFLLGLVRARSGAPGDETRVAAVDAVIFTAAVSSVLWVGVIEPNITVPGVSGAARAFALGYPTAVAVLVALAARLFLSTGRKRSAPEVLLLVWVAGELVGDVVYGYQSANGTLRYGSPVFVAWLVSYTAVAALAAHPRLAEMAAPGDVADAAARPRVGVLLAASLMPLALAAGEARAGNSANVQVLLATAAVTFALVMVRLSLLATDLREQRRLARELERLSAELRYRALHDPLTGLGNRALLMERLEHAISHRPLRPGASTALLLLDLDGFKNVNDTLGHAAGDELLCQVAERLARSLRPADTVARLGGDEFGVILTQASVGHILRTTGRLLETLRVAADVNGRGYSARASAGVCVAQPGDDAPTALRNADLAMYAAKEHGGDRYELFRPELHRAFVERHELELALREAASAGQLRLHYQPVVDMRTSAVVSAEALVRWEHPTRGLLYPDAFIEVAEDSGSIISVGRWVLRAACEQMREWVQRGVVSPGFQIAVNVSRRQLLDPRITEDVADILAATGTRGDELVLEVTETALMTETDLLIEVLERLRTLGITVAMDDFGTGYSSLEQLRRLPVDILKIDRGFVQGIDHGREEYALATAIVKLAASLDKETVAEGVETAGQAAHLRALDTTFAQGYLFSRPLPAAEAAAVFGTLGRGATA